MDSVWSKQPFKLAYILFQFIKIPIVILLGARFALTPLRPLRQWSFKTSLITDLTRHYFIFLTKTRTNQLSMVKADHNKAKGRYSLAEPVASSIYTGVLAPGTAKPLAVGSMWFPEPITPSPAGDDRIVIHFVGGAFVLAMNSQMMGQVASDNLVQHFGAKAVFVAQYRPASSPDTRFPAALQDLVTVYHHVLSLGFKPADVILSGDSAGGNLVLGLLRYLEESSVLPLPAGVMAWSPWVHVTERAGKDFSESRNSEVDLLVPSLLQWGVEAYWPAGGASRAALPYISPLHHPFKSTVPLYLHGCTAEGLYDTICDFAHEMVSVNGDRVQLGVTEFATHNLILCHEALNMTSQLESALKDARRHFALAERK